MEKKITLNQWHVYRRDKMMREVVRRLENEDMARGGK